MAQARRASKAKAKAVTKTTAPRTKAAAKASAPKKPATKKSAPKKSALKKAAAGTAKAKPAARKSSGKYELKTKETPVSVDAFLAGVADPKRVAQARIAMEILQRVTGEAPKMWGPSIVGYGKYRYVYDSGHSGEMCMAGFSPRKAQFVFYVMGRPPQTDEIWARLGKHKLGGSCLYVNRFEDIDLGVLEALLSRSVVSMRAKYPA